MLSIKTITGAAKPAAGRETYDTRELAGSLKVMLNGHKQRRVSELLTNRQPSVWNASFDLTLVHGSRKVAWFHVK
jgi:hypothetical protein